MMMMSPLLYHVQKLNDNDDDWMIIVEVRAKPMAIFVGALQLHRVR